MEWEFRDTDKDMSIVRIDMEDFWEDDPAEDPFVSNKGKARYSKRNISADKIIDVLDMSGIKRPGDLGISRDEWLAQVSKKLTEMFGGGGIPDYTTMPAYGLKRGRKGKHKFFVPKGEKLPAGVAAIKEGYPEIEFVCANEEFCDATDPDAQEALWDDLNEVQGIVAYKQDWSHEDPVGNAISMAVIIKDKNDKKVPVPSE